MGHSTRRVNSSSRNTEVNDLDWMIQSGHSIISDDFVSDLFPSSHPTGWSTDATRAPPLQAQTMSPSIGQPYSSQASPPTGPSRRPPFQHGIVVDHLTPRVGSFPGRNPFQGQETFPHHTSSPEQITRTEHEFFSFNSSESHPPFAGLTANDPNTTESAPRGRGQRGRNSGGNFPEPVSCLWDGCTYPNPFTRDGSLWRHIKAQHIFREHHKCPWCEKTFGMGRRDRLRNHVAVVHGVRMASR